MTLEVQTDLQPWGNLVRMLTWRKTVAVFRNNVDMVHLVLMGFRRDKCNIMRGRHWGPWTTRLTLDGPRPGTTRRPRDDTGAPGGHGAPSPEQDSCCDVFGRTLYFTVLMEALPALWCVQVSADGRTRQRHITALLCVDEEHCPETVLPWPRPNAPGPPHSQTAAD